MVSNRVLAIEVVIVIVNADKIVSYNVHPDLVLIHSIGNFFTVH
jgi:hypothetical protein